jgi:AcrR family transcriptional regulator
MTFELPTTPPAQDRRVRRSRSALMAAAVALVTERGSVAVPVSDIADAADVSRQLVYQQFGDRDTLVLEAALDLIQRELLARIADVSHATERASTLAMARYFADHQGFYRALLTSSCAFALNKALTGLFMPLNRQHIRQMCGERLDHRTVDDLATFITGGAAVVVNTWVVEGEDPLDPEEFTDRLMRMRSVVTAAMTNDKEPGR